MDIEINKEYFWADSKVVLGYISNSSKRFKIFVANRIQFIRDHTDVAQWYYVPSAYNPADDSSRGLDGIKSSKSQRWFKGPSFFSQPEDQWPNQISAEVNAGDPEVYKTSCCSECHCHRIRPSVTTGRKNVKLGKNEESCSPYFEAEDCYYKK